MKKSSGAHGVKKPGAKFKDNRLKPSKTKLPAKKGRKY